MEMFYERGDIRLLVGEKDVLCLDCSENSTEKCIYVYTMYSQSVNSNGK
jgi:hypothetical protein